VHGAKTENAQSGIVMPEGVARRFVLEERKALN